MIGTQYVFSFVIEQLSLVEKNAPISVCSHAHITKLARIVRAEKRERNNGMTDRQQSLSLYYNRRKKTRKERVRRRSGFFLSLYVLFSSLQQPPTRLCHLSYSSFAHMLKDREGKSLR
jgi:hypothetical protein